MVFVLKDEDDYNNYIKNNIIRKFCKNNKIDFISIDTSEDYLIPLEQFFNTRIHRH